LTGKSALVTGGGTGIGRAVAAALVRAGCQVAIASRDAAALQKTAAALGPKVVAVACDVRKKADVVRAVGEAEARLGPLSILINNAGLGYQATVEDCPEDKFDQIIETNLKGTFLMSQAVLPGMKARRAGFILNICSQAALRGYPEAGPYCASKFAIIGLSDALQKEVQSFGIHVHCLNPALVEVKEPGQTPGKLTVGDVADAVLWVLGRPGHVKLDNVGLYAW
jgi:NAD(P)-dependent dehydrogenase (short-subunit alcohol dehydrogenase family)